MSAASIIPQGNRARIDATPYRPVGLATAAPSRLHHASVMLLVAMLVLATGILWARAGEPGPALPVFVGAYQTAVAVCDLLTALMLFSQFFQFRTANLLVLSCGYLFTAIIVTVHLASFPGVFAAGGAIGGDVNTPPWLWTIWHALFPLTVLLFAFVRGPALERPERATVIAMFATAAALWAAYAWSTQYNGLLPPMIVDREFTPFFLGVLYPAMMALCVAAIAALLWRPAQYPMITLYLVLATCGLLLDVVNNWHSGARYALGWYLGRANSLVGSMSLCVVFVVENAVLLRYANRAAADQKSKEAQLKAAKAEAERANNAKSRFLAAASHDLRQPLSALSLYMDSLGPRLAGEDSGLFTAMKRCVTNLNEMLGGLLDLSKLEAGAVEPKVSDFAVDQVVAQVMSANGPEAQQKGLALRGRHCSLVGRTDPMLFRRIVGNLVANAIRYTAHGGVLIGCRRRGGRMWLEVWDTGIGIPADKTDEIFEEFKQLGNVERNRLKGTGLGLAIVAKTAALLGLEIRVRSRLGRGSLFAVEVPLGERVRPHRPFDYAHRPLRVAVIEDDDEVAAALSYALGHAGHQVVTAASHAALLPLLGGNAPQIVISDYRLGEREDGLDVVAALRSRFGAALPAIILTGDTDPAVVSRLTGQGMAIHHKPVNLDALQARIAELTAA